MKRLSCLCALLLCSSNLLAAPDYRQQAFRLPAMTESLVVADMNADGLMDLLSVVEQSIRIYFQSAQGFNFEQQFQEIRFDANAVGWDLSTRFSSTDSTALIALIDGRELLAWEFDGANPPQSRQIESNLPGFLSRGINRLHFARDINGDEADDLIIPGAGQLHLLINNGDNSFQPPLSIQSEMRLRSALNNDRFNRSAGQAISIPQLELRDVNADSHDDLVSRTEERLDVFLADPIGSAWFPPRASYSLDIAAIEAELGELDIDNLDFSNLTGVLALTHEEILEDVDGDGIADLLLREGGKVSLFGGHSQGMNFEQPRQVLRSGGNVLTTFLYDENEDGLKDLWLWRVEPVSVGDVFVWLALSGSIAIEAFIYPNDGQRFARRPARRITVDLRFPSVMRLANAYEELNRSTDAVAPGEIPPNRLAEVDGDNSAGDLLVLLQQRLDIFLNSIEPEEEQQDFLGPLGYSRQRDNYEIDIRQIIEDVDVRNNPRLAAVAERSADLSIPLDESVSNGDVIPARLNQDAVDDIFVFTGFDASHIRGLLLLSN
jgi:hypothetical protein